MNLLQLLDELKRDDAFMRTVTEWRVIPASEGAYADMPAYLDERLVGALASRGLTRLYSHQREALDAARAGLNPVIVTPTASGKTLCYNLPVLGAVLDNPDSRALYLFPTKALSADQQVELFSLVERVGADIKAYTYDGDTSVSARRSIRSAGHIVVTNPDMLHSGILPNHTRWVKLFENLKYVVIDEIHTYRGVFGSNLANLMRRLKRICAFYGARPQFICCSATIKNPGELASMIIGEDVTLIDKSGAPTAARHVVLINPPVVNAQLGIRKSSVFEARALASRLVNNDIQTIVFARSRLMVEVLATYLKRLVEDGLGNADTVRAYRGGFLPTLRREIERGLRARDITAVVTTNALELGIDIGALEACVLCGYPGTIASTWQQAGRAGRRQGVSALFLVATSAPLDQYIVSHPEYFFGQSPESAQCNPDNLYVLMNHIKCAAYELPFRQGEPFADEESTAQMLRYLEDEGVLRDVGGTFHWSAEEFPASEISMRNGGEENFLIIDITRPDHVVMGEMDRYTVPMLLHERAIYMHEGQQYQVEKLDFDDKKAYIRAVDVDYYTDASMSVSLRVLDVFREENGARAGRFFGEVLVSSIVTMFKKIKFDTHENLGFGPVDLPGIDLHTAAAWLTLPDALFEGFSADTAQGAMVGVANLMRSIAPLYLMCAPHDIQVSYHVKDTFTQRPTLYVYDTAPGGTGLSEKVYDMFGALLGSAREQIEGCPCEGGCPSCVGPLLEVTEGGKRAAVAILERLIEAVGA